jgi:hypothetical protein
MRIRISKRAEFYEVSKSEYSKVSYSTSYFEAHALLVPESTRLIMHTIRLVSEGYRPSSSDFELVAHILENALRFSNVAGTANSELLT